MGKKIVLFGCVFKILLSIKNGMLCRRKRRYMLCTVRVSFLPFRK